MARRGRMWVPVDVNMVADAADAGITPAAGWLYLAILSDCKARRTNGVISWSSLRQLGVNGYWKSLPLLIRSGWIEQVSDTQYRVTAWDKWHESEEAIAARQKADRDRKRVRGKVPPKLWRVPD